MNQNNVTRLLIPLTKSTSQALAKFARRFGVSLVVLFGSAATGRKTAEDVDVALLIPELIREKYESNVNEYTNLWVALGEALGISEDHLDITFISPKTPPLLLYHIARDGKLLFGPESDWNRFRLYAVKIYFDSAPLRRALDMYLRKALYAG